MLRVETELLGRVIEHRADAVPKDAHVRVVAGRDLHLLGVVVERDSGNQSGDSQAVKP